ncbi:MAG: 30S ribosomal protein S12 methylthiotransferase RimO [Erysipelotrichia bacterium]|nr:30S ribosomal protein S12 methylthiotransferase RimO [Erysipelotrichia bacterium]NCC54655.1 30S ribosomal protein S12 methylthiotransferase RimO [Erysipelotrichia bacterium]
MKIGFISLGCSKNLVDSETMMGMLTQGGHTLVNEPSLADAIIINTCGFIDPAKEEAINTILEMAEYKKQNLQKLIVAGCLAQRYKEDLTLEMPEVDRFISIKEYPHLHEILAKELGNPLTSYSKSERLLSSKPWTAYLKIAEGCSNHCTYCAIPLIRGDNVSYPLEQIVLQAKELAKKGVKELVIIAQDTTKYGVDLYKKRALLKVLEEVNQIAGFHWIRVLYMYPDEIDESLIEGMSQLDKVLPYFDIPMQHASNRMLKLMNRRGSKEDVLKTIASIRSHFKYPTLRTTFIVGFPEESEADFEEMVAFVKQVKWNSMGAFTYSPEEDTPAYEMLDQIEESVKEERLTKLMSIQKEISLANNQAMIGEVIEVLVESQDGLVGKYRGRSSFNAPDDVDGLVIFKSERVIEFGSFVKVKIIDALPYDLIGEEYLD